MVSVGTGRAFVVIRALDLPLNLQGNPHNRFHSVLTGVRARCVAQAPIPRYPTPGSEAGDQSDPRQADSNRDSNRNSPRQASAAGSTRGHSDVAC